MTYTTLDTIVRRTLLEKGLPIHWYPEYLFHSSACLRELSFDTLKIVNTIKLPLNNYFAVDLPNDFVDDIAVAIPASGRLQYVAKINNINPLRVHDNTGSFVPYQVNNANQTDNQDIFFGLAPGALWFWNFNEWGEPTGRYFGAGGGARQNGYQVIKKRRQIQLTETFTSPDIILMYISDGQSIDNATQVETLAFSAIQSYGSWKSSINANNERSAEGMAYYNQRRLLRARLNDLTLTDIREIFRQNYHASIKN